MLCIIYEGRQMLTVRLPTLETYMNEVRPSVLKSLSQVLDYMGLKDDSAVYFNGEAEVSKLIGGTYEAKNGDNRTTDIGFQKRIFVEFEESESGYNDGLDNTGLEHATAPVWRDPITGSSMRQLFQNRLFNITINKYFNDKVSAENFVNTIRSKLLAPQVNSLFNTKVHFAINDPMVTCFKHVFDRLMIAGSLAPETKFLDWFTGNCTTEYSFISNHAGNQTHFVFMKEICENGINYQIPDFTKVTKGAYIGKYIASFSYNFHWAKQIEWELKYPIMINQQLMEESFIPDVFDDHKQDFVKTRFMESQVAQKLFGRYDRMDPFYFVFPTQDNWRPKNIDWMSPQLQILLVVEDVQSQPLLNICNINDFNWNPDIIKFILKYHDKVLYRHKSPFQIKVFSDDTEVLDYQLFLDVDGTLTLKRPPTMSSIYRFIFYFDFALHLYDEDCVNDIMKDKEYGNLIIDTLFPGYVRPEFRPDYDGGDGSGGSGGGGKPGDYEWGNNQPTDWWDLIDNVLPGDGEPVYPFPTGMMSARLIAYNEETYADFMRKRGKYGPSNYWN